MNLKPIALVIPWYGDDIRGGAEMECNYLAHSLTNAGARVEVFTTCVKDAAADRGVNTLKPGAAMESGILVRRFPVKKQNLERYVPANLKIYHNENYTLEDERAYFEEDINSPEMYRYIREHQKLYYCFIFIPYLYGITFNGSSECMDKAILIPCLHDESYAYMETLQDKMKSFKGLIFLSKPEALLAQKLYHIPVEHTAVLGGGLDTEWHSTCDPQAFRQKYSIDSPFVLFAGRKDAGKKADELVEFFAHYKKEHPKSPLKLVFIGGGSLAISAEMSNEVFDLGFVSIEDKHNAFAAAELLCNPSYFESFSLVIMESWLAKRPVLVSEHCSVTTDFCQETNGGLWYKNCAEFCACLDYLLTHPEDGNKMGANGFSYVMERFTHKKIAENYLNFIRGVIE